MVPGIRNCSSDALEITPNAPSPPQPLTASHPSMRSSFLSRSFANAGSAAPTPRHESHPDSSCGSTMCLRDSSATVASNVSTVTGGSSDAASATAARHSDAVAASRSRFVASVATICRTSRSGRSARPGATSRGFSQTTKSGSWPSPASPAARWIVIASCPSGTASFTRSSCRSANGVTASIQEGGPSGRPNCRAICPAWLNFQRAFCQPETLATSAAASSGAAAFQRARSASRIKDGSRADAGSPPDEVSDDQSVARYFSFKSRSRATAATASPPFERRSRSASVASRYFSIGRNPSWPPSTTTPGAMTVCAEAAA